MIHLTAAPIRVTNEHRSVDCGRVHSPTGTV